MKCLWLSRDIPFPLDAGDKIYSANLARALAAQTQLRYLGFLGTDKEQVPRDWVGDWIAVDGKKRGNKAALFSRHPSIAAMHATAEYNRLLERQLEEEWDAILFDGYGSGWALQEYLRKRDRGRKPALIYVSHNHEESLWRSMAASQSAPLRKLVVWQNYWKARTLEREMVRNASLVTTITDEDAQAYSSATPATPSIVLTPGFSGPVKAARTITAETPRRVVMVGSFRWLIKQENLKHFVRAADARFAQHGIALDVVGDVPAPLLEELRRHVKATQFHGYVDDVMKYFDRARIALVPEQVGGGFKLKFLDYVFGRVPVATIAAAAAGLPSRLKDNLLAYQTIDELVQGVIAHIDQLETLNRLQERAYAEAADLFRWEDRGQRLYQAIDGLRSH